MTALCLRVRAHPAPNSRLDGLAHLQALLGGRAALPAVLRVARAESLGLTPFSAPQA